VACSCGGCAANMAHHTGTPDQPIALRRAWAACGCGSCAARGRAGACAAWTRAPPPPPRLSTPSATRRSLILRQSAHARRRTWPWLRASARRSSSACGPPELPLRQLQALVRIQTPGDPGVGASVRVGLCDTAGQLRRGEEAGGTPGQAGLATLQTQDAFANPRCLHLPLMAYGCSHKTSQTAF